MTMQKSVYKELLSLRTHNVINIDRLAFASKKDEETYIRETKESPSSYVSLAPYLKRLCMSA